MLSLPSFRGLMAASNSMSLYGGLPVFPGMPLPMSYADSLLAASSSSSSSDVKNADFKSSRTLFTQSELDMLLYGYATPKSQTEAGSALSGLRLTQENIDKGLHKGTSKFAQEGFHEINNMTLPQGIAIHQSAFAGLQHFSVFSCKPFKMGEMFGPFEGKVVNTSEIKTKDNNAHMWEIFKDGKLSHFVDGKGATSKWMSYVNCARYPQEQNLDAVQIEDSIFYRANKDIPEKKELLVWYGSDYDVFMGIPMGPKNTTTDINERKLPTEPEPSSDSKGYSCERCGKVFAYKYYKDKHLKYTKCVDQGDRKFPCTICSRSFEKRDRLRIHILHVHEKHRPHKCTVCEKCFSQSSSLNKHMRVHSGERPYKCVYCNKAFTASSILRTHIRQHSGEKPFKCKFCGKAFASHAAHDSHVRRTHSQEKAAEKKKAEKSCSVCGKTFSQIQELTQHMKTHHIKGVDGEHKEEVNVVN